MDSYDTLVIILSITLAIFLVLAIIATSLLIALLKKANRAAEHVETITENISDISDTMKHASGPAALVRILSQLIRR